MAACSRKGSNYAFVSTASLLEQFLLSGYEVVAASQVRSRNRDSYAAHLVQLRNPDLPKLHDGSEPRLLLSNSHDGTTTLRMYFGVFRFACANGLIAHALPAFQTSFPHRGRAAALAKTLSKGFIDLVPRMGRRIDQMRSTPLNPVERRAFAAEALRLRFGLSAPVSVEEVLQIRRAEDVGNDVWTTFNRVQENLVRGGLRITPRHKGRNRFTRTLTSIRSVVPFNRALWALSERFAGITADDAVEDRSLD